MTTPPVNPDALLDRIFTIANEVMSSSIRSRGGPIVLPTNWDALDDLAQGILDLHDHICKGGELPKKWRRT